MYFKLFSPKIERERERVVGENVCQSEIALSTEAASCLLSQSALVAPIRPRESFPRDLTIHSNAVSVRHCSIHALNS